MKFKLDIEDDALDFEGWAFLHFHSIMPGYVFADSLNRLYDYDLTRIDDMVLEGAAWPMFRYENAVQHCLFFLVERPAAATEAPWEAGDKLLVIKGEHAETVARDIFADFTGNAVYDEADLLAREHADLLDSLLAAFTVVNILDFSTAPVSRKAVKERQQVQECCDTMLAYIEQKRLDLTGMER